MRLPGARIAWWGMSFSVPWGDGYVHFGWKFFRDSRQFGNKRTPEYGVVFYTRRNRKGLRGKPHALKLVVMAA